MYQTDNNSTSCRFILIDAMGKEVLDFPLPCDKKEYTFSVASLRNGLYLYKVAGTMDIIGKGKLAISK